MQLPALVISDHSVQQHPLRAVQLLGHHGHLDVVIKQSATYRKRVTGPRLVKVELSYSSKDKMMRPFGTNPQSSYYILIDYKSLPSCGTIILVISEESFFFSSTRVSISFIRFSISSVILAAVFLSALTHTGEESDHIITLTANSPFPCTNVFPAVT